MATISMGQQTSVKPSDCIGATIIINPGSFELDFTGDGGDVDDFSAYPSLKDLKEKNSIWTEFTAPFDGIYTFTASSNETFINALIFHGFDRDICGKIGSGAYEIARFMKNIDKSKIGLAQETGSGFLFPVHLKQGEILYTAFFTHDSKRHRMRLNVKFEPLSMEEATKELIKLSDFHVSFDRPILSVSLRNAANGLPVEGQLILKSSKTKEAMYKGTDFIFDFEKVGRIQLSVDAEGFFFYDREEVLNEYTDQEIVIWLEPLALGKQMEIKGIEFQMGSSEFATGTESKLRRLRDFLILNSDICIEIQGHVHSDGDNSLAGKRMSIARAKRVMNYLIDNGIDKKRLVAVGYGNEFMLYPEPKFAHEEQANRRVEIKILEMPEY